MLDVEALGIAPMGDVTAHALDYRAQLGGDVFQWACPLKGIITLTQQLTRTIFPIRGIGAGHGE